MKKIKKNPHIWLIVSLFLLCVVSHYLEVASHFHIGIGVKRHATERILFILPIVYTGFIFGVVNGFIALGVGLLLMLPRAIFFAHSRPDALIETFGIAIVSGLVIIWFEGLQKEKEQRQQAILQLEKTKIELQSSLQIIKVNEKRLSAINKISSILSQSLELEKTTESVINKIIEVMEMPIGLIFLLEEKKQELILTTHRGVSPNFVREAEKIKVGKGFNGKVAQSGKPMVVEDSSCDPELSNEIIKKEKIGSQLIAPLKSKGKTVGTLCVAVRGFRQFLSEEIDLLCAIGNEIGVFVENSYLYQKEKQTSRQLEKMKENLNFYLHQITRTQEDERKRIARELHDETIQNLVALERQIDIILSSKKKISNPHITTLEDMRKKIDGILEEVRRFAHDLRPSMLEDLGLVPTLEWLSQDITKNFNVATEVKTKGNKRRLSSEIELMLFRIVQEALRNIWKHSQARKAEVIVEFNSDKINITIADNGKGFELPVTLTDLSPAGKLGLIGMQERAKLIRGNLRINSKPEKGTKIQIEVPA